MQPYRERRFASRFDSLLHEAGSIGWMAVLAALRAIGRNKLRAGLTMLGMFIGVAALIAMVAVGEGARAAVEAQVQSLGTDLLVVLPGTTRVNGVRAGNGSAASLRVKDVGAILEEDGAVADVSYVNRQSTQVGQRQPELEHQRSRHLAKLSVNSSLAGDGGPHASPIRTIMTALSCACWARPC